MNLNDILSQSSRNSRNCRGKGCITPRYKGEYMVTIRVNQEVGYICKSCLKGINALIELQEELPRLKLDTKYENNQTVFYILDENMPFVKGSGKSLQEAISNYKELIAFLQEGVSDSSPSTNL